MARSLNELELKWVELLLIPSFERKQILVEQLKNAIVISEIIEPVISLKLKTTSNSVFPFKERVPAQMLAFQPNGDSIDFLLHVIDGYIDELEIYSTSGNSVSPNHILLDNIKYDTFSKPGSYFYE